jgi:two-component system, response regulator
MTNHCVEILLIDDNMEDAELTKRELKKHNMANHILHLKNGKEALDFIFAVENLNNPPKVVLLDIQMPKINGIQVLQKIKGDARTRSLPVVMLTSSKESPDITSCYNLGANSYIVKPVNFEGFATAIKSLGFYWLLLNQAPDGK